MSHLKYLAEDFDRTSESNQNLRVKLVLEMIEYSMTYPPQESVEPEELDAVKKRVHSIIKELESKGDHLFAYRIHKIWKKRNHLLQIAENAHHLKRDYMDDIEYHEEVMWIRNNVDHLEGMLSM